MAVLWIEYYRVCQPFYFDAAVKVCFVRIVVEYNVEFVPAIVYCTSHNLTGLYLVINNNNIFANINHNYKDKDFYVIKFIVSYSCSLNGIV